VPLALATVALPTSGGLNAAPAVASNGSEVFILTAASGGVIQECNVGGCNQSPVTIASSGFDNTNNTGSGGLLALGGSWLYWPGQASVQDVTTANPQTSVFAQPANASVYAVATNTTRVLWSDAKLGILSCALGATCAAPSTVVPLSSLAAAPQIVAADQSYVYWSDANGGIFSAPLGGGAPVVLSPGDDAGGGFGGPVSAMVAAAGRVYYVDPNTSQLMTATGGTASSAAVYSSDSVTALATDGTTLYFATAASISRCALGASCATPTWIYGTTASSIAVDAKNLYWIDSSFNLAGPTVWEYHK
jgi:hypothetical protein